MTLRRRSKPHGDSKSLSGRRHQYAGRQTGWRVDRLHHSAEGPASAPTDQPAAAAPARDPTAAMRRPHAAGRARAARPNLPQPTNSLAGRKEGRKVYNTPGSQLG